MARGKRRMPPGIERRERADGTVSYRASWRAGGARAGRRESETFESLRDAEDYRAAVRLAGWQRPADLACRAGRLVY